MTRRKRAGSVLLVLAGALCAPLLPAHGGQYRGPGDAMPPLPGSGPPSTGLPPGLAGLRPGGSSGSSAGAAGGNPSGARSPGSAGIATPTLGVATGAAIGVDYGAWQFWWEFNKEPFLRLKEAVHRPVTHSDEFFMGSGKAVGAADSLRPTARSIRSEVLPALKTALDTFEDRDLNSAVLMALGKIGTEHPEIQVLKLMRDRLAANDQEIRETAALALGLSGFPEAGELLVALASDSSRGRSLVGRSTVDDRTRCFALYGLGLLCAARPDEPRIAAELLGISSSLLDDPKLVSHNLAIAAVHALGCMQPDPHSRRGQIQLEAILDLLHRYHSAERGPATQALQAHAATAIARLLEPLRGPMTKALRLRAAAALLDDLESDSESRRSHIALHQSAVLALGHLLDAPSPESRDGVDRRGLDALLRAAASSRNQNARRFAYIALGRIGGPEARAHLLATLDTGSKAIEKPWAALALGVLEHERLKRDPSSGTDATIGRSLTRWLLESRNPDTVAAVAIGLGLSRFKDSSLHLIRLLDEHAHQDELAGYLAVALALMDEQRAREPILSLARSSLRRPLRLQQCSVALGLLGDKEVTTELQQMMFEGDANVAKLGALAAALGRIGDRRSIAPLTEVILREDLTPLSRAFAAVALGGVADRHMLPWNARFAVDCNYLAAVETLTDGNAGILDIF